MKRILLLLAFSLPVLSCTKTIKDLEFTGSNVITFAKGIGITTVSFTAYSDWTAECDAAWVKISPASGTAGSDGVPASIKVTASANTEYDDRSAVISITSNEKIYTVSITQAQKTAVIISESKQTVDYTAQNVTFRGQANVERTVEISPSCARWISYTQTKALSSFDITLAIAENETDSERRGRVYVRSSTDSEVGDTVTIIQKGKPSILLCEKPGLYRSRVMMAGYTEYESQTGFFNRVSGTNEFHIINSEKRKYCLFKGLKPVGEDGPESPYAVNALQNMSTRVDSEMELSLTVYKYEQGTIWAQDEEKGLGVIIKVK